MKDLKFEQKRSLSRMEAADQLSALADALREGGDVELEFGPGTLSLRIPDDLRTEIEVEVGDGEVELELEFTWPTARARAAAPRADAPAKQSESRKKVAAKPGRSGTGAGRSGGAKPAAAKAS
ncbi:amphi-Trp domain-containing protein [Streptomyces sp. 3330]|uniref:amphi-Trp domain-containing protein n=1 Tax=Streptomyces sp. 3330 TaxID=2817755 RepID=UPI0028677553|nr:amphi-Trp domain-containing protein [Streptomyces sp. 3330]MDR6974237.1 amphi-Trp domain-containing protein [Streptomyces sp. 3330]